MPGMLADPQAADNVDVGTARIEKECAVLCFDLGLVLPGRVPPTTPA
jgi:hypothetical protein